MELPPLSLHLVTGLLVGGFSLISIALGVSGQVEAGVFPRRGFLYRFFVSDAESYKQLRQPMRGLVALFLVAFYVVFLLGPPYLIFHDIFGTSAAPAADCIATRKKFGGLQCSAGCVARAGACVPE